jgi:hypothetical protein
MLDLPTQILNVLTLFSPLFSKPVYKNVLLLLIGHLLTKGRRTIADILRTLDLHQLKNFSKFHWVLSGAKWSALKASGILFAEIINIFSPQEIIIPIDTHVERRKGEKILGLGRQRDAVRSTKNRKVLTIGLLWLVASVSVKLPGCPTSWSLPFFSQLIPPKRPLSNSRNKRDLSGKKIRRKTLTTSAIQLIKLVRRWLKKSIRFVIVADSAFACHKIAHICAKLGGGLVSRMRMDARIFNFPDQNKKRRGRPLLVGKRCPLFSDYLEDPNTPWKETLVNWYGGKTKRLLVYTGVHLWYAYGIRPLPIRWVLVKDPSNETAPVVLFSTHKDHTEERIIEIFVDRWPIEVTFEESRRHLGVETQRQWSDNAIQRTTPCIFGSFSITVLMAMRLSQESKNKIPIQDTAWYHKKHITFSDVLGYVRLAILKKKYYSKFGLKTELGKKDLETLILRAAAA